MQFEIIPTVSIIITGNKMQHLFVVKFLMLALGVWPIKLLDYKSIHPWILKVYSKYYYISWTFLAMFEVSQYILLIILINEGNKGAEILEVLSISILYTMNLYKINCCRSKNIQSLLFWITENEQQAIATDDEEIIKIQKKHSLQAHISSVLHVSTATLCVLTYVFYPIYANKQENLEGCDKKLIFSSWFPFDRSEYYFWALTIQFFGGYYGSSYAVYVDSLFFTIMIYCVGQMKILQHYLRNTNKYSGQYQKRTGCTLEEAQTVVVKSLIDKHKEIINCVELLDEVISILMLMDFILFSIKQAILIIQFVNNPVINFESMRVLTFIIAVFLQIAFIYWNANAIFLESTEGISSAIFNGDWYLLNQKSQKDLLLMMMRTNVPSRISIGPFSTVNLQAALQIIKSIYSYVAVMYQK
ncbi:uncharacterized protein LOC126264572 [Aethina tumida]|uniref:uncharacterized protein LOC126264572 n=1 Tax=Aethina tumida TaxID=116153 RepID=UPI0021475185|nr:uncharacterized protein LOC126264572 [Aethina tumida]